jgi:nicotinamidase-related amidase
MKILVVVDMQNDFIDGALGTPEAEKIVPEAAEKIRTFEGRVLFTRDTHEPDYAETQEGRKLPVAHCIRGTGGWQLRAEIDALRTEPAIDKNTFGCILLAETLRELHQNSPIERIELIGLCTDICVISNALLLKAFLPEIPILVDASCCAGVTPERHRQALSAMQACQIDILNA